MTNNKPSFPLVKNGYAPDSVDQYISTMAQGIEQLKAAVNSYETKFRELAKVSITLKEQSEKDRARLGDVLIEANKTAEAIKAQGRLESENIRAEADADAERIRLAAVSEAVKLKEQLDAQMLAMCDTLEKINEAMEQNRQNSLRLYGDVDTSIRKASGLLHTWRQNSSQVDVQLYTLKQTAKAPAGNDEFYAAMSEMLKGVQGPRRAEEDTRPFYYPGGE